MAQKFYVVWAGRLAGIFTDWSMAQRSVDKYPGARFKSFPTYEEAEQAFRRGDPGAKAKTTTRGKRAGQNRRAAPIAHQFEVSIYCDGACDPNPGHSGSGLAVYRAGQLAQLWYGLYNPKGTNNTAELNALFHALRMAEAEIIAGHTVEVCSDSAYSINCIRRWASNWEKRGWKKPGGAIVRNLEIIQDCYAIYRRIEKELELTHVAGHVGTEGNELADRMAMFAARTREKELRLYSDPLDIPTLLRMRSG